MFIIRHFPNKSESNERNFTLSVRQSQKIIFQTIRIRARKYYLKIVRHQSKQNTVWNYNLNKLSVTLFVRMFLYARRPYYVIIVTVLFVSQQSIHF